MASNNWGFKLPSNYVNRYRWSSPKKSLGNYKWIPIKIKGKKMRISEQALEQIIKEEVQTALLELAPLPGAVKSPARPTADPKALVKAPPELSKRPVPKWYLDSWIKAGKPEKGSTKWHVWFNTARSQARAAASKPPAKGQQAAQKAAPAAQKAAPTGEKTGAELFGRGARCPKCTYAKEGGNYVKKQPIPANSRKGKQITKALARQK